MGEITASSSWKSAYPGAVVGMMVVENITNAKSSPALDAVKKRVEADLRERIPSRQIILEDPIMQAYTDYYKQFRKSYHVMLQVESVALKGRSIPNVNAVVTAMFTAELKNYLLTAGHDLDSTQGPITLDISKGDEVYTKLNGEQQALKAGDMMVSDDLGVLSDVIYGPDQRSQITLNTQRALFVVYAPPGVPEANVSNHLEDVVRFIQLVHRKPRVQHPKFTLSRNKRTDPDWEKSKTI